MANRIMEKIKASAEIVPEAPLSGKRRSRD
jgi:hypothetical protein